MSCLCLLLSFPGNDLDSEVRTESQGTAEFQPLSWGLFLSPQNRPSLGGGRGKNVMEKENLAVASVGCFILFSLVSLLLLGIIFLSSAKL